MMAYRGVVDDVRKAAALERPEKLPVFVCSEEADVRLAGSRYDRYNSDAEEMARVQIAAVETFDYDWAWLQVDDCIEFEPLGVEVEGGGDILPATCGYLPTTDESLQRLCDHGYRVEGRMQALLDAIGRVKSHFGDTVCVTGRTAAPFSSVSLAFGIQETMLLLFDQPEFVREACKILGDYQLRFGLDQLEAGADAIWFGDCNASGHLISPDIYRGYAMEPARELTRAYQDAGGIVIYHASEEKPAMVELQADVGFSLLSVGPGLDIEQARDLVAGKCGLCGNVDPILVLAQGTAQQVQDAVERTITNVSTRGAHVLNSGEMVPRDTPEENLRVFVETARKCWAALGS